MNIYLIERGNFSIPGTYDSMVVVAENEKLARLMHPSKIVTHLKDNKWMSTNYKGEEYEYKYHTWFDPTDVSQLKVKHLGVASSKYKKPSVLTSSFYEGDIFHEKRKYCS